MTSSRELGSFHELLVETAGRLLEAEPRFETAFKTITDTLPGFRSNTLPANGGTPTGSQPENYETINTDAAVTALAELKHHVRLAFASAAAVHRIVERWNPTPGTTKKTKTLDPQDWCRSCLRIAKCSPRHRGDLCRWCYDFTKSTGQQPPIELVRDHHEGRRITDERVKDALRIRA